MDFFGNQGNEFLSSSLTGKQDYTITDDQYLQPRVKGSRRVFDWSKGTPMDPERTTDTRERDRGNSRSQGQPGSSSSSSSSSSVATGTAQEPETGGNRFKPQSG